MTTLNLQSRKVNQKTANEIAAFVYENRNILSNELKMFYQDVKGFIEIQVRKAETRRMNMQQILDRSYNIDTYVLASGASSFTTEFI